MLCSVAMDMGCGSSKGAVVVDTNKGIVKYVDIIKELSMHHLPRRDVSFEEASEMQTKDVNEMWAIVQKTSDKEPIHVEPVKNRKGWRTIRIFVSSTFKDFQQEREVLVKEVFPDLRLWCEQRKLRLVECDLRWGVPKDSTTEETIKICLSELDRCYEDNVAPFFLNLAGERTGWIPKSSDITQNLAAQYGWVYGLSVTEMEIVHGAFRKLNPNAIFMFRDRDSLNDLPDEVREDFIDTDDHCIEKVKVLKEMIKKTFPEKNIYHYKVQGRMEDENAIMDGLSGDSKFSKMVYDFFKTRIEELYPLDTRPRNFLQAQREAHETFLDNWSRCVLGRDKMIDEVKCYINSNTTHSSLVIIGTAGAGKSAVMAKCASDAMHMFYADEISGEQKKWRVFFHFVGATPGSTDLAFFLQRLTKEVKPDLKDIVSDLETLIQLSNSLLSNPNTEPVILFIDAVNQLDEDKQLLLRRWLPENLSSNVRVVVSTTKNTQSHEMLKMYKPHPAEIICGALNVDSRKEIVHNFLKIYNKQLDDEQLDKLLLKQGSSNPLWLSIACEELRVFGNFEKLIGKIESLPNELISLEIEVISRFEAETDALLMKATLCLLEVSRHGLLETELLALLGDDSSIKCPEYVEGAFIPIKGDADFFINGGSTLFKPPKTKNSAKVVTRQKSKLIKFLPARDWAIIYRNLKQLLRPCGDLGEGRLDFYHRSLSKAVRQMYFKGCEDYETQMYHYWHEVLAEYFEHNDGDVDRKAEELPFHLEYLLDTNRLMRCLLDWPLFNKLYNEDFSIDLLGSWQKAGGYAVAAALYKESLLLLSESGMPLSELADQMEKVAMFLIQAGQYSDALSLLEKRIQYENEKLGERVDKLADIYQLMALCKSEVVKQHPLMYKYMYRFLYKSQLVEHRKVVELLRKTNTYREKLDGEQQKFKIAVNNILLCFHLTIMSTLDVNSAGEYREEGLNVINEAMEFFEKTNDLGHLSDAIMTKTFMNANATFDEKKKQLEKAFVLSLRAYGKGHSMYIRICISIGLLHERSGDYYTAYEYFTEWKNAAREIYGPNHIKSIRSNETLDSPMYKRIKEEKEREESS